MRKRAWPVDADRNSPSALGPQRSPDRNSSRSREGLELSSVEGSQLNPWRPFAVYQLSRVPGLMHEGSVLHDAPVKCAVR